MCPKQAVCVSKHAEAMVRGVWGHVDLCHAFPSVLLIALLKPNF